MSAIPATTGATEDYYTSSVTAKEKEKAVTSQEDMVSQEEFLELLVTQLTNQDPLKPTENQEFISQLAQLQSLDEQIESNGYLATMANNNDLGNASAMIGMMVTGQLEGGSLTGGVVQSASMRDGVASVNLQDGSSIPLENIQSVKFYSE